MDENPYVMKILEEALLNGNIHIAARRGLLFRASYKANSHSIKKAKSDRGLPHLYLLLAAAIKNDSQMKDQADMQYQYPLSLHSTCTLERSLRHVYVELYLHEGEIHARLQEVSDEIDGMPGFSSREASGSSIEEALSNALNSPPVRVIGFRVE